jgi:thiosulfate/3-mercaptopyruvate sulfurtransferase
MRKNLTGLFVLVCFVRVVAQDAPILVSATWLQDHLQDPKVVVLQTGYIRLDFEQEHIEGSQFLWTGWLAPDSPEGSMNAPNLIDASQKLSALGVSNDSHVIICHPYNDVSPSARMFLSLEYLGMKGKVSFLNGGLESWKRAGYSVTNKVSPARKGHFKAAVDPLLVDRFYVKDRLNDPATVIVDARYKRFYDGDPTGLPRDGHLPGAKNIPYNEMVDDKNEFKPVDQLEDYFKPVASKDKEVVAYCFIGQTASVVYMAGRILGYKMKLYDGSLQEWSRIKDLPMEKTEK